MPMLIWLARSSPPSVQTIYVIAGILAVIAGLLYSECQSASSVSLQSVGFTFSSSNLKKR